MALYIGIDLGTSSVKLLLVNHEGEVRKSIARDYRISYPKPGYSEQNAEDWWSAVCDALPELLCGYDGQDVQAIGVAGQMHGLVMLDQNDNLIRPVILWNDGRTDKECAYLNEKIGKEKLFAYTGNIAFAGFTAPKLLWVYENEPENFKRIEKIMLPKDYVNYRLCGIHATDYSDASGMLLLDVKNRCWSKEMCNICRVEEKMLPRLYESYEVIGTISSGLAEKFGINKKAAIIAGAGDNAAAAIGTGTSGKGKCNISIGTSGTVFITDPHFKADLSQAIHAFCHADGGYHLMGCMLSAASCNKWFCNEVLNTENFEEREHMIEETMLGRNEVFFLPYLMGERSPINDTDATGLFIGLRPDTSGAQMHLALLEGVAFAIKDNVEAIKAMGISIEESTLCGGGAHSALWKKIFANVLGIDLHTLVAEQGPGYGAAILSMVGTGDHPSIESCIKRFVKIKETVSPNPLLTELYREKYERFRKIYPTVKNLYKEIKG